jgi:hypothetical protein
MSKCLLAAGCLALLAVALPAPAQEVRPVRLALRPAAAPTPALRYRLLPALVEKQPGNAVEHYRKAVEAMEKARKAAGDGEKAPAKRLSGWLDRTPAELPRDAVRKFLADYGEVFPPLDRAARSEHCDWGLAERARQQRYTLLSENQSLHGLAGFLALRTRLEAAEGHTDRALRTLQTGFAFARHVGESPSLAGFLAGAEIASAMIRELEQLLAQPKAPNLYWALADLPRPFLDLRKPLEGERIAAYALFFPGLRDVVGDPDARALKPEQVKAGVDALFTFDIPKTFPTRAALTLWVRRKHDGSKAALVAAGRPRARVEEMPHMQVALLHAMEQYDRLLDEFLKWQNFPDPEALQGIKQAERVLRQARANALSLAPEVPALPLAPLIMAPYYRPFFARARLDRQFAALRCVEAVRLYAAAHGGKWPPTLGAIKEVPVPPDPHTGKPFVYRVGKGSATLEGPPPDGEEATERNALRYELTLTK